MYKKIEFQSEGATLRGRLYTPEANSKNLPVIIMTLRYSTTIEGMVADRYVYNLAPEPKQLIEITP